MPTGEFRTRKVSEYCSDDKWRSSYSTFQLYLANATAISVLRSVKEQEAYFEELSKALEIERRCVHNQLEKYKSTQELGSFGNLSKFKSKSLEKEEFFNFYNISPLSRSVDSILRKTKSNPLSMADTHHLIINRKTESTVEEERTRIERLEEVQRLYYPDQGTDIRHYIQSQDVAPQESYSVSYQMLTTTNGHNNIDEGSLGGGGADISPSSSQLSVGGGMSENAQLISRSTAQTKTQQVKTVTKVITTREVRHIGPDGLPIDYPPPGSIYGSVGGGPAVPGGDYGTYPYTGSGGLDYGTYDSGRPPSPGGQVPAHAYGPGDYSSSHYGSTPSPAGPNIGSPRSYDYYSPHPGGAPPHHPKYPGDYRDYQDYPTQPPSPPSGTSESPPPRRAVPQAPRNVDNLGMPPTQGYDDLVPPMGSGSLHRSSLYHPSPSPAPGDMFSPYGYTTGPQMTPPTSTGLPTYSPFEVAPPQGYLDRRPSYDDHPQNQQANSRPNVTYGTAQHPGSPPTVYNDNSSLLPPEEASIPSQLLQHPLNTQPRHSPHPLDFDHMGEGENRDVRWRDPDLHEVIEFLGHPNNVVRANAAAYLQHLCFMDDIMKQKTRALGGIPPLIELVNQEIPEIQRNACGALRNLSYGRQNDENKRAFRSAGGIPTLVRLLRKTPDNEIRELVTGILWNLSSCEDLKRTIIDDALSVLVNHIIIPQSGWDRHRDPNDVHQVSGAMKGQEIYWSTVFRNASGVLRNVSSAGEYARRKLRECEGLVDALLHLVRAAIGKNDMDNKSVENCICILRNLSYRCQEVEDPDYDRHAPPSSTATSPQSRAVAGLKAVGDNLGCFGASKKKKEMQQNASSSDKQNNRKEGPASPSGAGASGGPLGGASNTPSRPRSDPPRGMELLWQPEVVQPYLALLSECSNPETLEAAAGAIQNLAACYWQPSVDVRAAVRKEKGLPILVELLRMEVDRVVCAVATALRNLAMDHRNKELIGKHAMDDLVKKLPNGDPQHDAGTSDDTIAAVLATLNEVIVKNCDFAHSLLEARGVQRLTYLMKQRGRYSPRVVKFASQLLYNMWQHQELRDVYKKAGWKESHFVSRSMMSANRNAANYAGGKGAGGANSSSSSPASSANNTLNRPISTQGGTKYEDRTLPRGGTRDQNNSLGQHHDMSNQHHQHMGGGPMGPGYYGQNADEMPLSDMGGHEILQSTQPLHRPPIGGVPIFPPGPTSGMGSGGVHLPLEPVYAQVNRGEKKKNRHHPSEMSSQAMLLDHEASAAAGDSWV